MTIQIIIYIIPWILFILLAVVYIMNRKARKRKDKLMKHFIQSTIFYEVHNHMATHLHEIRVAKRMSDLDVTANNLAKSINDAVQNKIINL